MAKSVLRDKSYLFPIAVVMVCRSLQKEQKEFVLSNQLLRSGTAVGALLREAEFGQSKADFIHKLTISPKEANETQYWLNLLHDTNYIEKEPFLSLSSNCAKLNKMLVASINTSKSKKNDKHQTQLFTIHYSLFTNSTVHFSLYTSISCTATQPRLAPQRLARQNPA